MRDKAVRGRALKKLTHEQVAAIRADPRAGIVLAAEFGVTNQMISRIRLGQRHAA